MLTFKYTYEIGAPLTAHYYTDALAAQRMTGTLATTLVALIALNASVRCYQQNLSQFNKFSLCLCACNDRQRTYVRCGKQNANNHIQAYIG